MIWIFSSTFNIQSYHKQNMSEKIDWNKQTVAQLKDALKQRGLDQGGKKAELVSRLETSNCENNFIM